jgi:surface carbohydrate biosynthesis protein
MSLFYLPVEISKRELIGKIFLGAKLASEGHQVIIFESSLFDSTHWPHPGTYIGKNCFRTERPTSMSYYNKMKAQGINVWLLDEEGGIFSGKGEAEWRKRLMARFDVSKLDHNDRIFSWGRWQADAYGAEKHDAPITITGSPSFDVLQSKYKKSLESFDQLQTQGLENYILINTRFTTSNGLRSIKWWISNQSPEVDQELLADEIINDGIMQYHMTALVKKLSYQLPEEEFVIRPHPAEDISFYKDIFQYTENVSVIPHGDASSWIRRSKALIHYGCTTAIQAEIYGARVITYHPKTIGLYDGPALPNRVGVICETYEEVFNSITDDHKPSYQPLWTDTISEINSIDCIASICRKSESRENISRLHHHLKLHFLIHKMKQKIIGLIRFLHYGKHQEYKASERKFDYTFFSSADKIFQAANTHYNADIDVTLTQKDYFLIEPIKNQGSMPQTKI